MRANMLLEWGKFKKKKKICTEFLWGIPLEDWREDGNIALK